MATSFEVRDVGDVFPDLALPTVDGGRLRLGDFRGRRLLMFSWSSW